MNRLKIISGLLFALILSHALVVALGSPLNGSTKGSCITTKLNNFIPWDSGCFYSAVFQESPTKEQIIYEHTKLSIFHRNGGVAQHVAWYRSVFYQRYKNHFAITYDSLDEIHKEFTATNPVRPVSQASYVNYLSVNGESQRAQNYMDYYCKVYVPRHAAENVVAILSDQFNKLKLSISLSVCEKKYE